VSRRLVNITLDNLEDLPTRCRKCVFWELDPVSMQRAEDAGDPALEKEAWISSTLLEWGSCGKLIYVDSVPAGFVMYAPPLYVPRSVAFPTSPVSADAALMMTAHILPEFQGGGLGRMLVQGVAKDLTRRGLRAIEAFGDLKWEKPGCVMPAEYMLAVGFKTVRPHHRFPRLRLELKSAVSWREDVEVALERLLGSMSPEGASADPRTAAELKTRPAQRSKAHRKPTRR
jgi:GNAT superfamily N-acetyltransferase